MGRPIIHGVVELGPVDFQIDAQTDEERAIAMRHVVHARVLLGQLAVRSSNAPLLSRKVIMHDGTVIEVGRNANQYTGQYNAFARIRVRRGGEERKPIAKAGGPFIWIGLRDNRDKDSEGIDCSSRSWRYGSPAVQRNDSRLATVTSAGRFSFRSPMPKSSRSSRHRAISRMERNW